MKTHQRNDRLTISQRNTRPKTLLHGRDNSIFPIPVDLVIDIFSRLPAKSVARCRCVSKLWGSVLSRQDFTELFLTRSSKHPQLLFSCPDNSKLFLFSAPQVQNENSCIQVTNHHMKLPFIYDYVYKMCGSVNGLVCVIYQRILEGQLKESVPVICNPSTGQSLTFLPQVKTKRASGSEVHGFFGYDPIGNQFKVLSMILHERISVEHQVLTLGTKNLSWRMVDCSITHYPLNSGICINGVLYYVAALKEDSEINMIICFDVRSEKFSYIKRDVDMILLTDSVLVNYKGKLGTLVPSGLDADEDEDEDEDEVTGETTSIELCVLEDAETQEWSKHVYELPSMWKNMVGTTKLDIVGMAGLNEIVLAPEFISNPFYVSYYNIESKTFRRVQIQGLDAFEEDCMVYTSVDHVEDVKLMDMFRTYNLRCFNKL